MAFLKLASWPGLVTIVGTAYSFLSVVVLHFLRTDYDPIEHQISNYATGSYGYLMSAAFIVWGIGIVALVAGVFQNVTPRPRVGGILVLIAGVAIIVAGVFPGDVITKDTPTSRTTPGAIHDLSSFVFFFSLIAAMFVMARSFNRDEKWRPIHRPAFWLAVASVVSLIVFVLGPIPESVKGLGQKIFVSWLVSWLLLTGIRLRFLGRSAASPT